MAKIDVQWEDEGSDFEQETSNTQEDHDQEFANMLAGNNQSSPIEAITVGDRIEASISFISEHSDDVMVDCGGKEAAIISKRELCDEEGQLKYSVGDKIEANVVSIDQGEIVLSQSLNHTMAKNHALESAYAARLPVKGKVVKVNKGGYEIRVLGKLAFCPFSQISLHFVENKEEFLHQELDFLIQQMSGRDIVVSRSALLKEKANEVLAQLRKNKDQQPLIAGHITQIRDFGAMVDLGGVTGMLHVSELSWGTVEHPRDVVSEGMQVKVKLLDIDESQQHQGMPRISLSLKQAQEDPWEKINQVLRVGESKTGRVVRLTNFGAFVEIVPGIDGLIHLSEMSWTKKIYHAKDLLKVGDRVNVRILDMDQAKRRISLSMKSIEEDPWHDAAQRFARGKQFSGVVEELKSFGAIVRIADGVTGLLPIKVLRQSFAASYRKKASPSQKLDVKIVQLDETQHKLLLTLVDVEEDDSLSQDFAEYKKMNLAKQEQKSPQALGSFGELLKKSLTKGSN